MLPFLLSAASSQLSHHLTKTAFSRPLLCPPAPPLNRLSLQVVPSPIISQPPGLPQATVTQPPSLAPECWSRAPVGAHRLLPSPALAWTKLPWDKREAGEENGDIDRKALSQLPRGDPLNLWRIPTGIVGRLNSGTIPGQSFSLAPRVTFTIH